MTNEFVSHGVKRTAKPRPFKPERVGHPEKLNQSLGVDVPQWYHPNVICRQEENWGEWATLERVCHPPTFGDQPKGGNPPSGVSDIVALYFNNPNLTQVSNTNLKVAPEWAVAFHELAEAYEKIDGGKGGSYEQGHNAALQREMMLRDQRPYLKEYNTGAGGPANSPNPQGGIIIKR